MGLENNIKSVGDIGIDIISSGAVNVVEMKISHGWMDRKKALEDKTSWSTVSGVKKMSI